MHSAKRFIGDASDPKALTVYLVTEMVVLDARGEPLTVFINLRRLRHGISG